jgi:hypothetical protein
MAGVFKILWRVNAVLVFLALVIIIAVLVLIAKEPVTKLLRPYFVALPSVAPVKPVYRYELEQDLLIGADTSREDFELFRLVRWGKARAGAPEASATVNLLLVDKKVGTNKWLFTGFDRAIVNQETVLTGRWYWREPEVDDDIAVDLVVIKVIDADSNGDGILTAEDRQTLYVVRFPAAGPQALLSADAIWFTSQKAKQYQIGYRDHGDGYLATYALPDFTLVSKVKVEGMPT